MSKKKIRKKAMIQPALQSMTGLGSGFGKKKFVDCPILMPIGEGAKTTHPTEEHDGIRYVAAYFPVCAMSHKIQSKLLADNYDVANMDDIQGPEVYELNRAMLTEILSPDGWRTLVNIDGEEIPYDANDRDGSIEMLSEAWIQCALIRSFSINLNQVAIVDDEKNSESGSEEQPKAAANSSPTLTISSE